MEETGQDTGGFSEGQLDAMYDGGGMGQPSEAPQAVPTETPDAQPTQGQQVTDSNGNVWEFTANGKQIQVNPETERDKILKWASMGHDYAQKMAEFKNEQAGFQSKYGQYEQIDQWLQENPHVFERIKAEMNGQTYQGQQDQYTDPNQVTDPMVARLQEQLAEQNKRLQVFEQERQQQLQAQEDERLDQEIRGIREKYPSLPWESNDPLTPGVEQQVLAHAQKNNLPSFKAAFLDLYSDQLLMKAQEDAKVQAAQQLQEQRKQGIIGQSPTPTTELTQPTDLKYKSYDDLAREALAEIPRHG